MTAIRFVGGLALLIAIGGPPVVAGWLCQRLLPARAFALRVLAAVIVAVAIVLLASELVGTVGWFRPVPLVLASALVSFGVLSGARFLARRNPDVDPQPAEPQTNADLRPWAGMVAVAAICAVAVRWFSMTTRSIMGGIDDVDSRQYHLPFAAEFVKTGWLTRLHPLWPDPIQLFYPANAEVLQAIGMMAMGRDVLGPLPNLGWFALLLLSGWCAGIRDRVAPLTVLVAAWVAGVPLVSYTNGGSALTDIAMLACLLAGVALWRNSEGDLGWSAVSGLALGLAVGVKLTAAPTAIALVVAMIVLAPKAKRRAMFDVLLVGVVAGCGFWYLRNLARTGSPLPSVPIPLLPSTDLPVVDRFGYNVAHYLFDGDVWSSTFWPGLLWFFSWSGLIALGTTLATIPSIVRDRRDRGMLALLICGAVGFVAYFFLPAGAWGLEGQPVVLLFTVNLRYLLPALLAIGTAAAIATARSSTRARALFAVGFAAAIAAEVVSQRESYKVYETYATQGVLIVAGLALALWAASRAPVSRRWRVAGAGVVLLVALAAFGPPLARTELEGTATRNAANPVLAWLTGVDHVRIGHFGLSDDYSLYGPSRSNDVEFIGVLGPRSAVRAPATCEELVAALARGSYDYVVFGPTTYFFDDFDYPAWAKTQPGTTQIVDAPPYAVFKVAPPYDPALCATASPPAPTP